ncbi:methyltransferase, FxLD system [Actinoplanes sp. NPDC020271]|uniref:methyltransferase, FxLD system n=1 Tax=Actinoplanes sp. NPDC020271 TaxID=3363896 RepID=UPI00379B6DD4
MMVTADDIAPRALRAELTARLVSKGWIRTPAVRAAFERVPRHLFVPATVTLADAYADEIVATKRGPDGKTMSSVSAPWLQAYMVEQAEIQPGARVLEIGSGGYNAALIAELAGPQGQIVTVDIDADVTTAARAYLDRAGYPHVHVVHGDGEHGHQTGAPYDAIIITVEAADIPPAIIEQLETDGVIVMPLRMRGITRTLTLRPRGDHLAATAALQCGFVPMQGAGRDLTRRILLRGDAVVLRLDDATEVDAAALAAALDRPRADVWSPVTITMQEGTSFEGLHLWLASQPRPFGTLIIDRERTAGLLDPQDKFTCPTLLSTDSLAYLTMRKTGDNCWQFGAHGFGPDAGTLTSDLIDLLTVWDRDYRPGPAPHITVHPTGTSLPDGDHLRLLVPRRHTTIAVTWPAPAGPR